MWESGFFSVLSPKEKKITFNSAIVHILSFGAGCILFYVFLGLFKIKELSNLKKITVIQSITKQLQTQPCEPFLL